MSTIDWNTVAGEIVRGAAAEAWRPREKLSVSEWAARYRVLDERSSASPGPWDNARTPYAVGVMDALSDDSVDEVTFVGPSQIAKSEVMLNAIGYWIDHDPGPVLYINGNRELARQFFRDRVKPMIEVCPRLTGRLAGDIDEQGTLSLIFDRMVAYSAGSNSPTNLRSKPIKFRVVDDLGVCEEGTAEEARQRGATYENGKLLKGGTFDYVGRGMEAEYALSDKRRYYVPCPHCKACIVLVWEGITWEGSIDADPDVVERTAWYTCHACKGRIENRDKAWMLARGVWAAEGETVEAQSTGGIAGETGGDCKAVVVGELKRSRHAGFWIEGAASPFRTFGQVARGFVETRGRIERLWWNGVVGKPWATKTGRVEIEELRRLIAPPPPGPGSEVGFAFGAVPAWACVLIASVDVQMDRMYIEVDAYGVRGEVAGLVWCGQVDSRENDGLHRLTALLDRGFPAGDGRLIAPLYWFIDSGKRTTEVYRFAKEHHRQGPAGTGRRNVYPVKGFGGGTGAESARKTRLSRMEEDGVELLLVNNLMWKNAIAAMLRPADVAEKKDDGGTMVEEAEASACRYILPWGVPDIFLKHLTSEERVEKPYGRGSIEVWVPRAVGRANHLWDTRVYNQAGADHFGVGAIEDKHKERMLALRCVGGRRPPEDGAAGKEDHGPPDKPDRPRYRMAGSAREARYGSDA